MVAKANFPQVESSPAACTLTHTWTGDPPLNVLQSINVSPVLGPGGPKCSAELCPWPGLQLPRFHTRALCEMVCAGLTLACGQMPSQPRSHCPSSTVSVPTERWGAVTLRKGLALFSLRAAEMLMVSDIQEHSPEQGALLGGRPSNHSSITQFLLLAFADTRELQLLHFWIFLGIYLAALLANGLIITAIACDHRLHTPMYFFLLNLSILDLGFISTTVPKSMANSLWGIKTISYSGCSAQVFFFLFLISAEFYLLTIMAYDRYVAICKPVHYGTLLGSRACVHMAVAAWGSAFLIAVLHTAITFSIPLCQGNAVDQFFCEVPQILKLSCSHSYLGELGLVVFHAFLFWLCFVFVVLSYLQIFRAVLRIPSEQGRQKAFSTCLPHLAVVSLFISTGTFAYLKPSSISSPSLDLVVVAVLYSVVPPAVNPLIYSMRNQELKESIRKVISEMVSTAVNIPSLFTGVNNRPKEFHPKRASFYLAF
ncbi:olfactory receptor 14J1-like [Chlamydotis macqueenii]